MKPLHKLRPLTAALAVFLAACGGGGGIYYASSTFAGTGTAGNTDGTGTSAAFNLPAMLAVDTNRNLYVPDLGNNTIRKITPTGVVTTLAGSTTAGSLDGTGAAASFNGPNGVAVDTAGNVYVADTLNNEIRKITPAGVVTTLAGSTTPGSADGTGSAASFNGPTDVAVDGSGNVYVADTLNNEIRKISPAGGVTTLAGSTVAGAADGSGAAASFNQLTGLAIDGSGNLYVGDTGNNEIRKVTPAGVVTTVAGTTTPGAADGTGSAASFNQPHGVTIDSSGDLYVADTANNEIRKIPPSGAVGTAAGTTTAGSTEGNGSAALFNQPLGITVDVYGNVFVADTQNDKIRKLTPTQ